MIEIVARTVCPTCGGNGRMRWQSNANNPGWRRVREGSKNTGTSRCQGCNATGTVPRVLATFADAAALRAVINAAINRDLGLDSCEDDEWNNTSAEVLAALGVNDDQS